MTEEYEQLKADAEAGKIKFEENSDSELKKKVVRLEEELCTERLKNTSLEEEVDKLKEELKDARTDLKAEREDYELMKDELEDAKRKLATMQNKCWNLEDDKDHLIEAMSHFSAAVAKNRLI